MTRAANFRTGYPAKVYIFWLGLALANPPETLPPPVSVVAESLGAPPTTTMPAALYLRALAAWQGGDTRMALDLARASQATGTALDAARLLEGYALIRLRRTTEALPILGELATDPAAGGLSRSLAEKAWRKRADRRSRHGVSASVGGEFWSRPQSGNTIAEFGYSLSIGVPIAELMGVRLDAGAHTNGARAMLSGPTTSLLATGTFPIGPGAWHGGLGAGPSVWYLTGPLEPDGAMRVEVGLRSVAWIDIRCWRSAGFALEAGSSAWPQMAPELLAYMFSWDGRISFVAWFGPGNKRPISVLP